MIAIRPRGGLCNRLRTMLGFYNLALLRGEPLAVCWEVDEACNGAFQDCFEPVSNTVFVSRGRFDSFMAGGDDISETFVGQDDAKCVLLKRGLPSDLAVSYRQCFVPVVTLAVVINHLAQSYDLARGLGIHVRRTDHVAVADDRVIGGHTKDTEFTAFLNAHGGYIYLATDNRATQESYIERYEGRVVFNAALSTEGKSLQRCSTLEDATVDLFVLSRCGRFMGSRYSSFSDTVRFLATERPVEDVF